MAAGSPIILAIECSQHAAEVALRDASGAVHSEALSPQRRHDDDLLPAIDRLLGRLGLGPPALRGGAVAVSIGPGGFTGLRIAVSTAKMFAEALGASIIAAPTALVAAESFHSSSARRLLIALASKNDAAWITRAVRDEAAQPWRIAGEPGLAEASALDFTDVDAMLADAHLPAAMRQRTQDAAVPVIEPTFRAAACLAVGARMLLAGQTTDPALLLPLYPRQPEAVTLWEARQKKGA